MSFPTHKQQIAMGELAKLIREVGEFTRGKMEIAQKIADEADLRLDVGGHWVRVEDVFSEWGRADFTDDDFMDRAWNHSTQNC